MINLYNYLSRRIEPFEKPQDKEVGLYTCGPTVYDYVHIGNWRTFVFEDILKRVLVFNGYEVKHVMNLTDIDDKIIKKTQEQKIGIDELTNKYANAFFADLKKLNIIPADIYPRARDPKYIGAMVSLIEKIVERGVGYVNDGSVYFSISKFKDYGKLSGTNIKGVKAGARVDVDEYDKENPQDFVLWKKAEEEVLGRGEAFDSPWGVGRPGWHIECSAMSVAEFGDPPSHKASADAKALADRSEGQAFIDIHTGGVDLLFPHHENEIAQSEAATGKKFVNIWMEGEHLLVSGEKMAKRLGNVYTLADIVKRGIDPLALRYLFLTAHYRSKLNFTWDSLEASQNALNNLRNLISNYQAPKIGCTEFEGNFKSAVNDDLNMPEALTILWKMVKSDYPESAKHRSLLVMDKILGLGFADLKKAELPKGAQELIDKREKLRVEGKFEESDKVRDMLGQMGVEIEDMSDGSVWRIKSK